MFISARCTWLVVVLRYGTEREVFQQYLYVVDVRRPPASACALYLYAQIFVVASAVVLFLLVSVVDIQI